jgi:2'-5' RNA ligase
VSDPLIVTAVFPREVQDELDDRRRRFFPPDRRVVGAHLTLFHALPADAEQEARELLDELTAAAAPQARIDEPFLLGRGVAHRVVSPGLERVRAAVASRFAGRMTRQDASRWSPHVTVQNKVERDEARRTLDAVAAEHVVRDTTVAALALWRYRGGPWDAVSEHPFASAGTASR